MKLFIAGCEPQEIRRMPLNAGASNYLLSYYHLIHKGGNSTGITQFMYEYKKLKEHTNADFIMDSGLFTMMFGADSGNTYTKKDLINYTHKYLANMKELGYKDTIVEMDVHKVLGMKELQEFRDLFISNYGIERTMFVWHIEETIKGWEEMCNKYSYVALSVPELRIVMQKKYLKPFMQKMINRALAINPDIKIHLLGCTSNSLLDVRGYYSADSTSWQQPLRYGDIKNPVTMRTVHQTQLNKDKLLKEYLEKDNYNVMKLGVKPTRLLTNKYYQISGYLSVKMFINMADQINKRHNTVHDNNLIYR